MHSPNRLSAIFSLAARGVSAPFSRGWVAALPLATLAFVMPAVTAGIFNDIPGLSQAARDAFVVQFDGRTGVTTNGFGGVTAWQGLDGSGNSLVTAVRAGNAGDGSDTNANISRNAGGTGLVFTESAVAETAHLFVPLVDGDGNNLLNGGAATIFWKGFYSSANPQGNATLGRYAYNISTAGFTSNVIHGGMNHQRRYQSSTPDKVASFTTPANTSAGSQTQYGDSIATYNDTSTVWTSEYGYTATDTNSLSFFATDASLMTTNLNVAAPTNDTTVFADLAAIPNLYIGAISFPTSTTSGTGGYSFIGEMEQLIVFEGSLSPTDVAAVQGYLVTVPEPSAIGLLAAVATAAAAFGRRRTV